MLLNGWLNVGVSEYGKTSPASPPSEVSDQFWGGESTGPVSRGRKIPFYSLKYRGWALPDPLLYHLGFSGNQGLF